MSVVVVATILPLPEHRAEVIAAFEQTIAQVHGEDGCDLYSLNEGADRLIMIEKWADQAALDTHARGPALRALGPLLDGKLATEIEVLVLTPHPAGTEAKGAL